MKIEVSKSQWSNEYVFNCADCNGYGVCHRNGYESACLFYGAIKIKLPKSYLLKDSKTNAPKAIRIPLDSTIKMADVKKIINDTKRRFLVEKTK